jgi:hypothetical protein
MGGRPMLTVETAGAMNIEQAGKEYSRRIVFSVANAYSRLVIVKSIDVEVLRVFPLAWGSAEGKMGRYERIVALSPDGPSRHKVWEDHKYGVGEADRFVLDLTTTKWGFAYYVRIVVSWYDTENRTVRETRTPVIMARFPLNHNDPSRAPIMLISSENLHRKAGSTGSFGGILRVRPSCLPVFL